MAQAQSSKNRQSTASSTGGHAVEDTRGLVEEEPSVMQTFKTEAKQFWKTRTISSVTWTTFILLNISNVCMLIWFMAPGWTWTTETGSNDILEGTYYGYYGIWYSCWDLIEELEGHRTSCSLTTEIDKDYFYEYWIMAQGMSICILVLGLAAFVLMCLYMFNNTVSGNFWVVIATDVILWLIACMNVSMSVAFGIEFYHIVRWECCDPEHGREILEYHLWYAYVISCLSAILYLGAAIAFIFEALNLKKAERIKRMYEEAMARRVNQPYSFEESSVDRFRPPYGYYPQMMMMNPNMMSTSRSTIR